MGAGVIGFVEWFLASKLVAVVIIRTILVNVVLGAATIELDGEIYDALDHDPRA